MALRILITSGGTKVPLDPVRDLTNMSNGSFGSRLAREALMSQTSPEVIYLVADGAASPFSIKSDFKDVGSHADTVESIFEVIRFAEEHRGNYHEVRYRTFDDYLTSLESLVKGYQPHIVMLAAAVSDYVPKNYCENKIRSSDAMSIDLIPAHKIIHSIKKWCPDTFLVGFKLLVGATDEELITAARESIAKNHCDLVIANEWNKLKSGNHEVLLVEPALVTQHTENVAAMVTRHSESIAANVIQRVLKRWDS